MKPHKHTPLPTDWRKLMKDQGKNFFNLETRAVLKQPQKVHHA